MDGEPNKIPMLPVVVFLNPDATQVLAKVLFEPDFVKRVHALVDSLGEAEASVDAASNTVNQSVQRPQPCGADQPGPDPGRLE